MRSGVQMTGRAGAHSITCILAVMLVAGAATRVLAQGTAGNAGEQARLNANANSLSHILSLPPPDVVPSLVWALRNEPAFQYDDLKHQAYSVLVSLNAVQHRSGVRQFIAGLADPVVSCQCLYALGGAPPRYHDEVLPALTQYVDHVLSGRVAPCRDTMALLDAIARLGTSARGLAPRFEGLVSDTTIPVRMRGTVARTLVKIGGIIRSIRATERLLDEDSVGARLMLHTLLLEGEARKWSFLKGPKTRAATAGLMTKLLAVRPDRTFMERVKLKPDSRVILAENEILLDRLEVGGVLIESIVRLNPSHARPVLVAWAEALRGVSDHDPTFAVRLKALERLHRAQQLTQYAGLN